MDYTASQLRRRIDVSERGTIREALETLGVPKQKWAQVRTKFMRVLLEEHDNILKSYQAQKHGSGNGMGDIAGQSMDFGLGPV